MGARLVKAEHPKKIASRKFRTAEYKIAQRTRGEESMLSSQAGTLVLLWVAETPQHPSDDVPHT